MTKDINKINQKQLTVLNDILKYGKEINASERVIQVAINFANAESTFNPSAISDTGTFKGLFQYKNATWEDSFKNFVLKNPKDLLAKESASASIFDEFAQIKIMYNNLSKWEEGYDEGKIAKNYKPGEDLYHVTEKLAAHDIDITTNFLHYAYLRHNTSADQIILVVSRDFTPENLAAIQKLIGASERSSTSSPDTAILSGGEPEELLDQNAKEDTAPPLATQKNQSTEEGICQEDNLGSGYTNYDDVCRESSIGGVVEFAVYPDNQETTGDASDSEDGLVDNPLNLPNEENDGDSMCREDGQCIAYAPEDGLCRDDLAGISPGNLLAPDHIDESVASTAFQGEQQDNADSEKELLAAVEDQAQEEGWFTWLADSMTDFFENLMAFFENLIPDFSQNSTGESTSSVPEDAQFQETWQENNNSAENCSQEEFFPYDLFEPLDLDSPQPFSLPNDLDYYVLHSDGSISKSQAIASTEGAGSTFVVNADTLPASREELLVQLLELGVSEQEAAALADGSQKFRWVTEEDADLIEEGGENSIDQDSLASFFDSLSDLWPTSGGDPEKVAKDKQDREADLALMQAQNNLSSAMSSENTVSMVKAGLEYYSSLERCSDTESNGNEPLLDSAIDAISLGQAIDCGDGLDIAGESVELLQDIDRYLDQSNSEYGNLIGKAGSAALCISASGIGLAQAIEADSEWGIAQSSVNIAQGVHSSLSDASGVTGDALAGAGSAIGLAMNIAQIDDVFDSGDTGAMVYTTLSTVNNAINTFNAAATLMGMADKCLTTVPGLAYVGAVIQLMQGDVVGAAISAATAALMACGPYGWVAAAVLQIGSMLFGDDDPPEATAAFTLDADGKVVMDARGDSAMVDTASACGHPMIALMENFQENGGRLQIDGTLPTLRVVQGEDARIEYRSDTGGAVSVMVADPSELLAEMSAALYARDRGDRLDSAVDICRDALGEIDFAQVDRIMAGYGFQKNGITYTYGETQALTGSSSGSGVFNGGGNVGPQGQHFVARAQDITSMPLRENQLPSQTMGDIVKIVSLNNAFAGAGAGLLAMAMLPGEVLGHAAPAGAAADIEVDGDRDAIKPLSRGELVEYRHNPAAFGPQAEDQVHYTSRPPGMPACTDVVQTRQRLDLQGGEVLPHPAAFADIAESAWFYRQPIGYHDLRSDGSRPGWIGAPLRDDDPLLRLGQPVKGPPVTAAGGDVETPERHSHTPGQSFTGGRIFAPAPDAPLDTLPDSPSDVPPESPTDDAAAGPPPASPVQQAGPVFVMAEDTTLRFLPAELLENTAPGRYGMGADALTFVAFGQVENGRLYRQANGDIRFEATAGFTGTGSFTYTVRTAEGVLLEKKATVKVENVNDTPLLQNDHFVLNEGEPFYLDALLANDTDPEGDTLTLDHLRGLTHGELTLIGGRLAFLPQAGYHGDVAFSYWAYDQTSAYPAMACATLTCLAQDSPVSMGDDCFMILEDTRLTVTVDQLLANDIELDGENFTFTGLEGGVHGRVEVQPDDTILFTPDPDYAGTAAGFGYRVTDDSGTESVGWVAVEVLNLQDAPVACATTGASIFEDEILTFTPEEVARFVYDADGDPLRLEFITRVTGGTIVTADGYYSFVPYPDYAGPASFDYRVSDNHRGLVDGHLAFEILPVNDPIEAGQDVLVTLEEQPVTVQVEQLLANDRDADGATVAFAGLGRSAHGSVSLAPDGAIVFAPETDYAGSEAGFAYFVRDEAGLESVGWVQVRAANVNDAPVIIGRSLNLVEDRPLTFDAATLAGFVRDADNDRLRIAGVTAVSGGTVALAGGVYTYTPDPNYHGGGGIELTVTDDHGEAVTAVLDLNIKGSDDPAALGEDLLTTTEEQPVAVTVADFMANDGDDDGPLTFVRLGEGFHGTAVLSVEGKIQFIPGKDYFGSEAGFEYVVSDPDGYEATGRVVIKVENVNDSPQITSGSLVAGEDQQILFNATTLAGFLVDPDGDVLTLTAVEEVSGGAIAESGGIFSFTPDRNYHGPASLRYRAGDGQGGTASGLLHIDLLPVDDPTDFGDHSYTTREEQPLEVAVADLLARDRDSDGRLEFFGLGAVEHGEVRLAADNILEFIPEKDYFGEDAGFSYVVRDGDGNHATGWVGVQVEAVNDPPEIVADRLYLREDERVTFDSAQVASFLNDADGDLLGLDFIEDVTGGTFTRDGGIYTFIPDADFYGEAGFGYLASNGAGETLAGRLAIAISPVNDLPQTTCLAASGSEDHEVTMTVAELMAGASDVEDGTNLQFAGIVSSLHGRVFVDSDRIVHFLPDQDFSGSGFFRYAVMDSEGGIGLGFVTIDLAPENDAPVAVDDERIVAWSNGCYENVYMASALLANDRDLDGDPLAIVATGPAEHGTVSVDGQGNIHYMAPANDWVGIDHFSYEITDGHGGRDTATVEIDVQRNTSPDVYSELVFTKEDIISVLSQDDLLANDADAEGDSLRIIAVDQAVYCSVVLQADGSIRFAPELNYNNSYPGSASFRYTVTDRVSDPVTGIAFIDIEPVNDGPILTGERINGAMEDNAFSFTASQLLANDRDVETSSPHEEDTLVLTGVWGAEHGSLFWDPGSGVIAYLPAANFFGVETFTYGVTDSCGAAATVTSEISIQPVNDRPVVEEDIGSPAEDSIWNSYSIAGLLGNDYDIDGDSLTAANPYVISGHADVAISGGDLKVKPAFGEDHLVIGYTVSDGHGGEVTSRLTIPEIREHNFAPTFSGIYSIGWKNSYTVWFNFHAEDKNGGNTWSNDSGDIVAISAAAPNHGQIWDEGLTFKFKGDVAGATVVLTAVDQAGATGSIFVRIDELSNVDGEFVYSPVVLDLDGDGVELVDLSAGVAFDWNRDGSPEATGWVGADDGLLVYDYDHDRVVRYADELALREYHPGAGTDLEGLQAFDSDHDGRFTAEDAEWQSFGVWRDANTDGISDDGEFAGLGDLGISAINLQSDKDFREQEGNLVYGTTTYETEDGSSHQLADVGLVGESLTLTEVQAPGELSLAQATPLTEEETTPAPELSTEPSVGEIATATTSPDPAVVAEEPPGPAVQVGETEASPPAGEPTLSFDDAEIDRQCLQLLSDMADSGECPPVDFSGIDIEVMDLPVPSATETLQDMLAVA